MHRDEVGFTLIEVVVTATFTTMAIIAIVSVFINIEDLNRRSRNLAIAAEIGQQKIESDRNLGYAAIPASEDFTSALPGNQFSAPKSAIASFVDLSPAVSGLKTLNITMYYTENGHRRDIQISTLIAQRGINK